MDILLKAELQYPKPSDEDTRIVFKGTHVFSEELIPGLKKILMLFGKPSNAQYYEEKYSDCVILEVDYPSQYQAYAAKIALDGLGFRKVGCVSVEVVVTANGIKFDQFVRHQFRFIAHNY